MRLHEFERAAEQLWAQEVSRTWSASLEGSELEGWEEDVMKRWGSEKYARRPQRFYVVATVVSRVIALGGKVSTDQKAGEAREGAEGEFEGDFLNYLKERADLGFISKSWLEGEIARELCRPVSIKAFSFGCLGGEAIGFLSSTFRVSITYNEPVPPAQAAPGGALPSSLVLKVAGCYSQEYAEVASRVNAYSREDDFYTRLAPGLENTKLRLPRVYASHVQGRNSAFLLMEDLSLTCAVGSQSKGIPRDRAEGLLTSIASLHARFWPRGGEAGGGGGEVPDFVEPCDGPNSFVKFVIDAFCGTYGLFVKSRGFEAIEHGWDAAKVLEIGERLSTQHEDLLKLFTSGMPQTLIHGDFRGDNFMLDNASSDCVVLDWQLYCSGPAAYDVVELVFGSMTWSDIQNHSESLLRHYHRTLCSLLAARGIEGYDWNSFCRDVKVSTLLLSYKMHFCSNAVTPCGRYARHDDESLPLYRALMRRVCGAIIEHDCLSVLPPAPSG